MPVMSFDLQDGKPPVSFSINNEGAERFMAFMAECQEIRDSKQPDSGYEGTFPDWRSRPISDSDLRNIKGEIDIGCHAMWEPLAFSYAHAYAHGIYEGDAEQDNLLAFVNACAVAVAQPDSGRDAALLQALRDIANPIEAMRREVPEGYRFEGAMAISQASSPEWYKRRAQLAIDAAMAAQGEKGGDHD